MNKIVSFMTSYKDDSQNTKIFIYLISILALINILSIFPDLYSIYSKNGIISESLNSNFVSADKIKVSTLTENIISLTSIEYKYAFIIPFYLYIISLIMILLNYWKILFAIIVIFLHTVFLNSAYLLSYGADFMIAFLLYINLFFCIEDQIKVESYKGIIFSFAVRLMQIQLCIIYFFGGFGKVLGFDWLDGNAIWLCVNHYLDEKVINSFFAHIPKFIYQLASLHVTILELLFPIFVFLSKNIRKWTVINIIIMHIVIALVIKIYTFSIAMLLFNIIAFYPGKFSILMKYLDEKRSVIFKQKNKNNEVTT